MRLEYLAAFAAKWAVYPEERAAMFAAYPAEPEAMFAVFLEEPPDSVLQVERLPEPQGFAPVREAWWRPFG